VREVVRFLSRENASIRISELQTAEPRRVFEPHKLAAYEAWGIIERDEHLIRLSELGGELAKRNTFEKQIYRQFCRICRNIEARSSGWASNICGL
jgi:predicted methyltransferase